VTASPSPALTAIEATTIRKLKTHIIPFVFVLFVINFVDRINIGFAALTMNKELAITSQQFGLLSGVFFWGYFIFEIPSNLLLHKLGARIWIARILVSWGIVAILMGFVRTATHLYILRFLLGVAEAGFVPGMYLYLTYWFPQRQLAQALALFNSAGAVASIVGAPMSGVILDHIHWLGLSSWRWLLILEGIPAVVGGIGTYFLLPSRPTEARFLTSEEAEFLVSKLAFQEQAKVAQEPIGVSQALAHTRVWHLTAAYFAGFSVDSIEQHNDALTEMVEQVRMKLLGAEIMTGLNKLQLPGIDLGAAKRMANSAMEAIRQGQLGYALICASRRDS
jgi:MFS transporter, ACS family, tartrate transporter